MYRLINGKIYKDGVVAKLPKLKLKSAETTQMEKLQKIAQGANLTDITNPVTEKKPKLSTLQRIVEGVNILNPTGAINRVMLGKNKTFLTEYWKDIAQRATSFVTGKIPERKITEGKELVKTLNITENKIAQTTLGLAADIILDSSTWFGGWAVKGVAKGAKVVGGTGLKLAGKIAPEAIGKITTAAEGIKDVLGKTFKYGYKSSEGLTAEMREALAKRGEIAQGILETGGKRTAQLGKETSELISQADIGVKRSVYEEESKVIDEYLKKFNDTFKPKKPLTSIDEAKALARGIEVTTSKQTKRIQEAIDILQKPVTDIYTKDLNDLIKALKLDIKELGIGSAKKITKNVLEETGIKVSPETIADNLWSTINLHRRELQETIGALESKLKYGKIGELGEIVAKGVGKKEVGVARLQQLNELLLKTQNTATLKQRILGAIVNPKNIARARKDIIPTIIRKDLTPTAKTIVAKLQKEGKKIPQIFRDTKAEMANAEFLARAKKSGESLVKAGGLAEETLPNVYYPFVSKSEKRLATLLATGQRLGVGKEGYKKVFKNLLKDDDMIVGTEAFAMRQAEVAVDIFSEKELTKLVSKYGKKFATPEAAKAAGYVPITRQGLASKFGKVLGYVSEYDSKVLNALIGKPEFDTINKLAKATGFDWFTGLFKRAVTGLFAPFHVRNWMSGMIQNYEVFGPRVMLPKIQANAFRLTHKILMDKPFKASEIIVLGGTKYRLNTLKELLKRRFFGGSQIYDVSDAMEYLVGKNKIISAESLKKTIKTLGLGQEAIPFRAARKVGEGIEMQQKAAGFLTALDMKKGTREALEMARKAGFDYRELTGFESKIMRRIIPFYAFNRFNTVLQIQTLLKNPQRIGALVKTINNLGDSGGETRESLPDFLANGFGIKIGTDKNGNPVFVSQFGTPVEAFAQMIDKNPLLKLISNANPLIKTPLELAFGKDSFRQKDLKDVYNASEYSSAPQFVKDLLQLRPVQKVKYVNNKPTKDTYTMYVANPERLLIARSLFTSRATTYLDYAFDGDLTGLGKTLRLITGVKAIPVDLESAKYLKERDTQRELEDLLVRYGAARQFNITYQPSTKKSGYKVGVKN